MITRVLIVEDEAILALDLKESLQEAGYAVVGTCPTAEEACQLCRELHPQLVLMDIKLQGTMSGTEAAQYVYRELGIPVVFLTSYVDQATTQKALAASPYGYLIKPYRPEALTVTLALALEQHQRQQQLRMDLDSIKHDAPSPEIISLSASAQYQLYSGRVMCDGAAVKLTSKEQQFLDLLGQNSNKVVTFERIYQTIWNTSQGKIQALRTLLHRVRMKAGGATAVNSVQDQGYQLIPFEPQDSGSSC